MKSVTTAPSYGVTQAGEIEIAHLDRRNHDRLAGIAAFARAHALGDAHRFQVVQHEDRRIVEPEILHRLRDLSVLDQKGSVAGQAGVENRAWIHRPQIPEACYQQTTLRRTNHVIERRRSAAHANRSAGTCRRASAASAPNTDRSRDSSRRRSRSIRRVASAIRHH